MVPKSIALNSRTLIVFIVGLGFPLNLGLIDFSRYNWKSNVRKEVYLHEKYKNLMNEGDQKPQMLCSKTVGLTVSSQASC